MALGLLGGRHVARLHQRAVKVEVVGHYRRAQDAHGDVERFAIQAEGRPAAARCVTEQAEPSVAVARNQTAQDLGELRPGEQDLEREAGSDRGHQRDDEGLHAPHAES